MLQPVTFDLEDLVRQWTACCGASLARTSSCALSVRTPPFRARRCRKDRAGRHEPRRQRTRRHAGRRPAHAPPGTLRPGMMPTNANGARRVSSCLRHRHRHGNGRSDDGQALSPSSRRKKSAKARDWGLPPSTESSKEQRADHVESTVGRGTPSPSSFPACRDGGRRDDDTGQAKPVRGTERILLVEDDDSVRRYVCSILESAGYTVFSAESGVAALDKLRTLPKPPDLLLQRTSSCQGCAGRVLAQDVTSRFPGVRVILMSGYAEVVAGVPRRLTPISTWSRNRSLP